MLIRTTPSLSNENRSSNPFPLVILLIIGLVAGGSWLFSTIEQNDNAKTIKSQAAYYDAFGATKAFWDEVEKRVEKDEVKTYKNYVEDVAARVYHYKIKLSSEVERPRYLYLGYTDRGRFIPQLVFPHIFDQKEDWFAATDPQP